MIDSRVFGTWGKVSIADTAGCEITWPKLASQTYATVAEAYAAASVGDEIEYTPDNGTEEPQWPTPAQ